MGESWPGALARRPIPVQVASAEHREAPAHPRVSAPSISARVWVAAEVADIRRGFDGLARQVRQTLQQDPFSGHIFAFRGRCGDLLKLMYWDSQGLCLFAKRLERGRFMWPAAKDGAVTLTLTPAQLSDAAGRHRLAHAGADLTACDGGLSRELPLHRRGGVRHNSLHGRPLRPA